MANIWRVLQNVVDCFQSTTAPCPAPSVEVWCCPCINKQTTIMHYPYESTYLKHNVWLELIHFERETILFIVLCLTMRESICICIQLCYKIHDEISYVFLHTTASALFHGHVTKAYEAWNYKIPSQNTFLRKKWRISHASNSVFLSLPIRWT